MKRILVSMTVAEYSIRYYVTDTGRRPFTDWLDSLRDRDAAGRIRARLRRLTAGNFGDARALEKGLWELRLDFGPGYRIYFIVVARSVVVIFTAGDKSTQKHDISRSRQYLADYLRRSDA